MLQGRLDFGDRSRSHRRPRSRVVSQTISLFRSIHEFAYIMPLFFILCSFKVSHILYGRVCLSLESKKLDDMTQICPFCTVDLDSIGVSTKKQTGLFQLKQSTRSSQQGYTRFPSDEEVTQCLRRDAGHLLIADRHQLRLVNWQE